MAAPMTNYALHIFTRKLVCQRYNFCIRLINDCFMTKTIFAKSNCANYTSDTPGVGGLAKAIERFDKINASAASDVVVDNETTDFKTMLQNSKLFQLGDVEGRVVVGTIIDVVSDDLYIDFGGKFHCVCKQPKVGSNEYHRNAKVKLRLKDLELSRKFLGSDMDITLLEADATLIGLYNPS